MKQQEIFSTLYVIDTVKLYLLEDPINMLQIYFYENLLIPLENSKIINHDNLTKAEVQKLLNGLFSLPKDRSEIN